MWLTLHRILYTLLFFLYEENTVDSAIFLKKKQTLFSHHFWPATKLITSKINVNTFKVIALKKIHPIQFIDVIILHSLCTLLHMFILVEISAMHASVYLIEMAFAFSYILFMKSKQSQRIFCCLHGKINCVCLFCEKWIWNRKQRQFFFD